MQDDNKTKQTSIKSDVPALSTNVSRTNSLTVPKSAQPFDADLQAHIGRKLLEVYDEVLAQPVPDRFLQLLDALDEKTNPPQDSKKTNK